jgi:hypothetical protein
MFMLFFKTADLEADDDDCAVSSTQLDLTFYIRPKSYNLDFIKMSQCDSVKYNKRFIFI